MKIHFYSCKYIKIHDILKHFSWLQTNLSIYCCYCRRWRSIRFKEICPIYWENMYAVHKNGHVMYAMRKNTRFLLAKKKCTRCVKWSRDVRDV